MDKKIVVPGELVTEERKRMGQHVYIQGGKIYSDVIGLARVSDETAFVVPLEGRYMPVEGDLVVGVVNDEKLFAYAVDLNHYYASFISKKELREPLKMGAVVSVKVMSVNEVNEIDLAFPRVFYGGNVLNVSPVKVPRLIGKNGSMLEVLKRGTGCSLVVGRNGKIWVKGDNLRLLVEAIQKIEDEAHLPNLTDKMVAFLKEKNPKADFEGFTGLDDEKREGSE